MAGSLIRHLLTLMPDEVTVEPHLVSDGAGNPTYAAGVIVPARVITKRELVRGEDGQERVSRAIAWLASGEVSTADRFTLPVRFGDPRNPSDLAARRPPAIAVDSLSDENGAHHNKVWF